MDTKQLRQKILDLAIRGKLVPQDPNDEPASVLLERVKAEKERLIAEGKIKRSKKSASSSDKPHYPFEIPDSWEWVRLDEISEIGTGATPSTKDSSYYNNGTICWVNSSKTNCEFITEPTTYITQKAIDETNCTIYPIGAIIMAMYGEGKTRGQISELKIFSATNQACAAIVPFIDEYKDFIKIFLKANYWKIRTLAEGGLQPNLNLKKISSYLIPMAPLEEQERIGVEVEKLMSFVDEIEQSTSLMNYSLSQVKAKILELAISGKLVPQDPADEPAEVLLKRVNPNAVVSADTSHYKFDIPNNWIISQLGSLFNHNTGKALNRSNQEGRMLDYITTSNLYWDRFELNNLKQMPFKDSEIDKCTVIKGDLLVCEGGDVGRAAIWNYDYSICIQNHIHRLRPIDNHLVFPRFYYYCFLLYKQQNLIGGKGIGIQGLSSNQLHKVVFPLPPLNEQKRIASKVDELFAVIDQIQQSLE
jgi:type I restriction enzyme S subunit